MDCPYIGGRSFLCALDSVSRHKAGVVGSRTDSCGGNKSWVKSIFDGINNCGLDGSFNNVIISCYSSVNGIDRSSNCSFNNHGSGIWECFGGIPCGCINDLMSKWSKYNSPSPGCGKSGLGNRCR